MILWFMKNVNHKDKNYVNFVNKIEEFISMMSNNGKLHRDEALCITMDILLYLPNGQQEYN